MSVLPGVSVYRFVGSFRNSLSGYFDRLLLVALNAVAASVSYSYQGELITFPQVFAVLHAVSALLLAVSCLHEGAVPYALSVSSGTFVGRALSIWVAVGTGTASQIPNGTLILAGLQWAALAWVIRPSTVAAVTIEELHAAEVRLRKQEEER